MRSRAAVAGPIVLKGATEAWGPTGIRLVQTVVQFGVILLACIGAIFTPVVFSTVMADGSPQAGVPTEFQQMMNMLQQMAQEQANQRVHLDTLQQAIGSTAQGVGITQQVTEGVVSEVVQQVQATMQQRHQETQDQFQQVVQIVNSLHQRIDQVQSAATSNGGGTPVGDAQTGQPSQRPQSPTSPVPPAGSPTNLGLPIQGPAVFAPMSPQMPQVNPAIAYAIQQGGVDAKVLAKPSVFDPVKQSGYSAFNDWSDHVITCVDAQIPGTWEILEYIKDHQPSSTMSVDDLNLHFPQVDKQTLEYSNSNLYAVLITYTANEARNIVRQARRPNGYEAWKLLHKRFNPVTIGRQRAGLTSIANPTANIPLAQLSSEIVSWESRIAEFEARPQSEKISEAIKMAAMVSMCPAKLKDHLQLNAQRFRNYQDLREEIFTYLDHTQAAASTAMDVGALHKGSGCFVCGGPHLAANCPKRQKGGAGYGKGGKDKGKGKGVGKDKGKGKKGPLGGGGKDSGKSKGNPLVQIVGRWATPKTNVGSQNPSHSTPSTRDCPNCSLSMPREP